MRKHVGQTRRIAMPTQRMCATGAASALSLTKTLAKPVAHNPSFNHRHGGSAGGRPTKTGSRHDVERANESGD